MQLKDIIARVINLDIFDARYEEVPFRFFSWAGVALLLIAYSFAYAIAYNQQSVVEKCIAAAASGGDVLETCPGVIKQVAMIVVLATAVLVIVAGGSVVLRQLNAWKLVDDAMVGTLIALLILCVAQSADVLKEPIAHLEGWQLYVFTSAAAVLVVLVITACNRRLALSLRGVFAPAPLFILLVIFSASFASQYTLVLA